MALVINASPCDPPPLPVASLRSAGSTKDASAMTHRATPPSDPVRSRPVPSLGRAACALALAIAPAIAAAQAQTSTYPSRPIRLLVPFAPGGSADVTARLVATPVGHSIGQTIVIDNRPGSGGTIATQEAARASPDGYTLGFTSGAQLGIAPAMHARLGYDPIKSFTHVIHLVDNAFVLVLHPSIPAATPKELAAWSKANRGKANAGSTGNGTYTHLTLELFKSLTGADLTHVPYKGAAPAITDLMGRQIQMMFVGTASVQPYIVAGRLKAIGITTAKRSPAVPDVPTFDEAGVPGLQVSAWFGISVPRGTPAPVIEKLAREFGKALQVPETKERFAQLGSDIAGHTGERFTRMVEQDVERWAKVVRTSGVKVE